MIKNYLKIAIRNLWRHKGFSLINIIGLAIGISAALVIYLIVQYDLTFDKFQKDNNRIYRVVTNFTFSGEPHCSPGVCTPLAGAVKDQVTGIAVVAPFYRLLLPDVTIPKYKADPGRFKQQENIILTDKGYFDLIPYKWLAGSPKMALNDPYQVVLTSSQAKLYFPEIPFEKMLGKTVLYDDTIKTTVTGIVQTLTEHTDFTFHDFISYTTAFANKDLKARLSLHNWSAARVQSQLFVKLLPATSVAQTEKQLNAILAQNNPPKKGKTQKLALQQLADIHFNTKYGGISNYDDVANKTMLYGLLAIALFLLLLGSINFINLTTARATQRAKEIGIRKTMGSSRTQLIFQFLSETYFITLIAVVMSAVMAPVIIKLFSAFIKPGVKLDFLHQPGILAFLLALSIVVSLLSGFYPAMVLSGYKPVSVLKNEAQSNTGKTRSVWMRRSLTITQFIITQFFIMATLLVAKQIYYVIHKDLGFKKDGIITINSPNKDRKVISDLVFLNKLRAMPQVEMVSMGNDAPSSENTSSTEGTYRDGKKEIKIDDLAEKFGDENYIKLYHIKLLAGRDLQPADSDKAFLVNVTLTKRLGFKDPQEAIGKVIDDFNGDTRMRIVGVVADFHQESLHAPIAPLVILSPDYDFSGVFHIALKPQTTGSNEWQKAINNMQVSWKQLYPNDDFEYQFVDEAIAKFYDKDGHTSTLLAWATGLSIFISCMGLLGLVIYTTSQRTKEIGVRKVLGASVTQMITLISGELIGLIVLAFIGVTPIAWWAMNNWLQNFADRTTISWWIFALSATVMLLAATITSGFQATRAAMANPIKSLRSE